MAITPRRAGVATAAVYLTFAVYIVIGDRRAPPAFLPYLPTFLVTAPFSVPLSWAGHEPDFRNLVVTLALVGATAALVYRVALGLTRIFGNVRRR